MWNDLDGGIKSQIDRYQMSDDTRNASRRPKWHRRLTVAVVSIAVIASALFGILLLTGSYRLQPDEIVRGYGTYDSPSKRYRIVVEESDNKMITVGFVSRSPWHSIVDRIVNRKPTRRVDRFTEFEVERDWFLCFDEFDRLWIFTGQRDSSIVTRKTSSGGFKPRVQSVGMRGFWFRRSRVMGVDMDVTGTGDWRGCPPQFFAQIPYKGDPSVAIWGEIPPIPKDPPEFTPAERVAIAAYWRNFDKAAQASSRGLFW